MPRRTFGASADAILLQSRKAFTNDIENDFLSSIDKFPAKELNTEIRKIYDVGDDYITELFKTQKDDRYSFPILAMLYPGLDYKNHNFHKDHLPPPGGGGGDYVDLTQEDKDSYGWEVYNSILNLQMLDANENIPKNDKSLKDWINEQTKDKDGFLEIHIIPIVNFDLENFSNFIERRRKMLIEKLKIILN